MHPVFRFVLAGLAAWRVAFLVAREDGPLRAFARLRPLLGRGGPCVKCLGVWVSIPLAFFVGGTWIELLVTWLALAGVVALVDEWTRPPFEWRETGGDSPGEAQGDELLRKRTNGAPD